MSTSNFITVTRSSIGRAIKEIQMGMRFETVTIEAEINESTTVFVDVECMAMNDYSVIEVTSVDVIKGGAKGSVYLDNIAKYIGEELDKTVEMMNLEEKERASAWDYQKDYETIGGMFAY